MGQLEIIKMAKASAVVVLLLLASYHMLRRHFDREKRSWPTIPYTILMTLGWWARWWLLLYLSFDVFLVNWRKTRAVTPIRPKTRVVGFDESPMVGLLEAMKATNP